MRNVSLVAALLLVAFVVACGGSDSEENKRFSKDDIGITFEYPGSLREANDVTVGERSDRVVSGISYGLGLDEDDLILIKRTDLNRVIDDSELDVVRAELDAGNARLGAGPGRPVSIGGIPGFEYRVTGSEGETKRATILIDGDRQYTITCQYVDRRERSRTRVKSS